MNAAQDYFATIGDRAALDRLGAFVSEAVANMDDDDMRGMADALTRGDYAAVGQLVEKARDTHIEAMTQAVMDRDNKTPAEAMRTLAVVYA